MLLGREVGLGPDNIVLDGDPAPPTDRGTTALPPLFGSYLLCPNGRPSQQLLSSRVIYEACVGVGTRRRSVPSLTATVK